MSTQNPCGISSNGKENWKMFTNYEFEDSEDYDNPNYWLQMDHRNAAAAGNLNSNFLAKSRDSEDVKESEYDHVTTSESGPNPAVWFKMDDGSVRDFVEKSDDIHQNQNSDEFQILDEEVVYTPKENSEDVPYSEDQILHEEVIYTPEDSDDVTWMDSDESDDVDPRFLDGNLIPTKRNSEDVTIQPSFYPLFHLSPNHEDHTYCKPNAREAKILETLDDVVRRHRFRRRRDVQNPPKPKSLLGPVSKKPYVQRIPKTPGPSTMERWIFVNQKWPNASEHLDPLGFSMNLLCRLACRNAPRGMVTTTCAVNFILHHFPYHRFDPRFSIVRVRHALTRNKDFESVPVAGKWRSMYFSLHPDNIQFTEDQKNAMDKDPRGRAFFDRMLRGELGLPRQLFYHIIGHTCQQFAGPENSALFYHLLSIGHIPTRGSAHFQTYRNPCTVDEPRFEESTEFYATSRFVSKVRELEYFGINRWRFFKDVVDKEFGKRFVASIGEYFETQNVWKSNGMRHWETPEFDL